MLINYQFNFILWIELLVWAEPLPWTEYLLHIPKAHFIMEGEKW